MHEDGPKTKGHPVVSGMRLAKFIGKPLFGPEFVVHPCPREVMYEDGPDGLPVVSGLRLAKAGEERIVKADAYVAALDVPGAKRLIPQVPHFSSWQDIPNQPCSREGRRLRRCAGFARC